MPTSSLTPSPLRSPELAACILHHARLSEFSTRELAAAAHMAAHLGLRNGSIVQGIDVKVSVCVMHCVRCRLIFFCSGPLISVSRCFEAFDYGWATAQRQ